MAKWFKHANVVCLRRNTAEESQFPLPADATDIVVFDDEANSALLADFDAGCNAYSLVGGQLLKNGSPVTIAADLPKTIHRKDFDAAAAQYLTDMQTYLALADTATAAQVRDQVKRLTQGMVRMVRIMQQLRSLQGQ